MKNLLYSKYRLSEACYARKDFEATARRSIYSRRELHLMVEELNERLALLPEGLRRLFNL